jgi:hypothetical protein
MSDLRKHCSDEVKKGDEGLRDDRIGKVEVRERFGSSHYKDSLRLDFEALEKKSIDRIPSRLIFKIIDILPVDSNTVMGPCVVLGFVHQR